MLRLGNLVCRCVCVCGLWLCVRDEPVYICSELNDPMQKVSCGYKGETLVER